MTILPLKNRISREIFLENLSIFIQILLEIN
jgi:hypothetical protein